MTLWYEKNEFIVKYDLPTNYELAGEFWYQKADGGECLLNEILNTVWSNNAAWTKVSYKKNTVQLPLLHTYLCSRSWLWLIYLRGLAGISRPCWVYDSYIVPELHSFQTSYACLCPLKPCLRWRKSLFGSILFPLLPLANLSALHRLCAASMRKTGYGFPRPFEESPLEDAVSRHKLDCLNTSTELLKKGLLKD